jgi:hypothetical protein
LFSGPELEPVQDPEVLAFASRIEGFYRGLEGVPFDVEMTFEDERLREHFDSKAAFTDYYASLAAQLRAAQFRNTRAERVEIRDFSFETPERARVYVALVGRHLRVLRFWEIETSRSDAWQLLDGRWVLTPERL